MLGVYIGAGIDIRRAILFSEGCKKLVLIDSQPYSENGLVGVGRVTKFIRLLKKQMCKSKMLPISESGNSFIYSNGKLEIEYITNTRIPENLDYVVEKIRDFELLIVIGHNPHSSIMNYTSKLVKFVGANGSPYIINSENSENSDSLLYRLNMDYSYRDRFTYYIYWTRLKKRLVYNYWILLVNDI